MFKVLERRTKSKIARHETTNSEIIYKKKKKICTVKPNAVTVFGTISLFQNHFIYFFLYHAPHMVFEIM